MFEFRRYEISNILRVGSVDMIKVSLKDEDASYFVSNTSLGFLPKGNGGSSALSEYILGGNDKTKYLCEVKIGEKVLAYENGRIFLSEVRDLERIKDTKAILIKVKTGRDLCGFPFFPQKYGTFSLEGDMIGKEMIASGSVKMGNVIECLEDIKQRPTHFGDKFGNDNLKEFLIEV